MHGADRLNYSAKETHNLYKGNISTSLAVVIETLLIGKRFGVPPETLIRHILSIATVDNYDNPTIMLAVRYITENKLSIFDAFHAALCNGKIISPDHVYDKLGIDRIKL
jgi:hypothetical protein